MSLQPMAEPGSTNITGGPCHSLTNATSAVTPMGMHETDGKDGERNKGGGRDKEERQDQKEKGGAEEY